MSADKKMDIRCLNKADKAWIKWMNLGGRIGCHQKPERSLYLKGYQMPVCARCTGVFIGYMISAISFLFPKIKYRKRTAAAGSTIMLADWSLQYFGLKESTNRRRFITGVLGGFGIMTLWISGIKWLFRHF